MARASEFQSKVGLGKAFSLYFWKSSSPFSGHKTNASPFGKVKELVTDFTSGGGLALQSWPPAIFFTSALATHVINGIFTILQDLDETYYISASFAYPMKVPRKKICDFMVDQYIRCQYFWPHLEKGTTE
ncbi:uncharacterized protein LOC6054282 [Culex quinquefasciatus]|uniref:uncharacterized protein LOC6054282 n=1 Tax=Culex quinquefasciatus TaxID=7176 RepID=UPI0018E3BBFE|nr:uncharacterized protein LOC6054282 [Culex quinquefasciatus]